MISDPDLVFYACVAKGITVLAEFNSKGADLGALAVRCLENAPSLHSAYYHTVRSKTYMFYFDEPFLYFAIFDENFENSEGLLFLKSVSSAFNEILPPYSFKSRLDTLHFHCFQAEFNSVFHQLLASPSYVESPSSQTLVLKRGYCNSGGLHSPRGKRTGSFPWLGDGPTILKKKKRLSGTSNGESRDEKKVDLFDDGKSMSRELSAGAQKTGLFAIDSGHQRAKRVWKKQVWVVLSLDLFLCTILFVIWLWVCGGFKCIDG